MYGRSSPFTWPLRMYLLSLRMCGIAFSRNAASFWAISFSGKYGTCTSFNHESFMWHLPFKLAHIKFGCGVDTAMKRSTFSGYVCANIHLINKKKTKNNKRAHNLVITLCCCCEFVAHIYPMAAPKSCPMIVAEFTPNDRMNCNSSLQIFSGV